ncbi:heme exporter protein CcmD [Thioclava sp. L04-15]|uniref:heme exporter protein CcmD n=1 Tax=Thioclava sp. L04-15 TaxID=1915318 RepID=UPI0009971AD5|nr:heme exporter protein CcmD [Thioclava sp. L04-15]OOY28281.1 heme exporter protein CcmD [Thioclava sp. L04-15]TNE83831.1 MAG: heme exporter protein CcmD [Paracoccaceae bacterium]
MTDTTGQGTTVTDGGVVLVDPSTKSYTYTVNIAWGATILLLVLIVVVSLMRGAKIKRQLAEAEARRKGGFDG